MRRDFIASSPNRLWVTDHTVVTTRTGAACVCLIVDAFSRLTVRRRFASCRGELLATGVAIA